MSLNKFHFFVAGFIVALVSQATSRANFTIKLYIHVNKMKAKSFDIYSEAIKRNDMLDIP